MQTELATLVHDKIGSISSLSSSGEPIIGRLAYAAAEGFKDPGPFSTAAEFFTAFGEAAAHRLGKKIQTSPTPFIRLGISVFCDIVSKTNLFKDITTERLFPLNHMDLFTQNILIDDDFNFVAIIDWEFAQSAPWQVNYYPMPLPLLHSDERIEEILRDPGHIAYKNTLKQKFTRGLYRQGFRNAEEDLKKKGRALTASFVDVLDGPASRIYGYFTQLGQQPEADKELVYGMVQLAFGLVDGEAEEYVRRVQYSLSSAATENAEGYDQESITPVDTPNDALIAQQN